MRLEDIDWTTDALGIIGVGGYYGIFSCNDPTNIIAVPKFTDIICKTSKMKEILFRYNMAISGQDARIVDARKLQDAAIKSPLLSFFEKNEKGFFIDERQYSKEEMERIKPLATILKNYYLNFDENYMDHMRNVYGHLLEFRLGDEFVVFDADEAKSMLMIKKDGNVFKANLMLGKSSTLALTGSNLYSCLSGLSDHIVLLANGANYQNGNYYGGDYKYNVNTSDDGRDLTAKVLRVGLSDELTQFREDRFGSDDGKGF